ncbi:zinc-binding dehydrogenase [Nonomuraea sp. NPDC050547]|uniref:zinc-dependent alcohol dehydrogenase n=1 Tax=unclassified Nonomuraea TaxID=2593643 RepID=UPI00378AAC76
MLAVLRIGPRRVEVRTLPATKAVRGQVSIKTAYAGICGTDVRHYLDPRARRQRRASGHELVGEIVCLGKGVRGLSVGQRVTARAYAHCGGCASCLSGRINLCQHRRWMAENGHGGFAGTATVMASAVMAIPPGLGHCAALAEPVAVAHRAVLTAYGDRTPENAGPPLQGRLAVIGGGTLGQLSLRVGRLLGVSALLMLARYPHQEAAAALAGAQTVTAGDAPENWADGVVVAAEGAHAIDTAVRLVRPGGVVALLGEHEESVPVNTRLLITKEAALKGSNTYACDRRDDMAASVAMLASGRLRAEEVVSHILPVREAAKAFALAADKSSGSIKVLLRHHGI